MHIELMDTTNVLLQEIAEPEFTRDTVALTYAMALCSSDKTDFKRVHQAIIERWSCSALEYIKREAWKKIDAKRGE